MDNSTRLQYLEAMGIDVWVPKVAAFIPEAGDELLIEPTTWTALEQAVSACSSCELGQQHYQSLLGEGDQQADWMIVGTLPVLNETQQAKVITGYAEQLLNEMLRAIGLSRDQVYLTPLLKCLPASPIEPNQSQANSCRRFLYQQIQLVQPKIILALGQTAAQFLLQSDQVLDELRNQLHKVQNIPLVVVNHPENLLLSLLDKKAAWLDLQRALKTYQASEA